MFRPLLSLCLALLVSAPAHADNIQTALLHKSGNYLAKW